MTSADEVGYFPPGTPLVAQGVRDLRDLTPGKRYVAVHGLEAGIFESRPFVTVVNDAGQEVGCHARRFTLAELAA